MGKWPVLRILDLSANNLEGTARRRMCQCSVFSLRLQSKPPVTGHSSELKGALRQIL